MRAIIIPDEAIREAQAERNEAVRAGMHDVQVDSEDVFIAQLHRRAKLVNKGFQQRVLDMLCQHHIPVEYERERSYSCLGESTTSPKELQPIYFFSKLVPNAEQEPSLGVDSPLQARDAAAFYHAEVIATSALDIENGIGHFNPISPFSRGLEKRRTSDAGLKRPSAMLFFSSNVGRTSSMATTSSEVMTNPNVEHSAYVELSCTFADGPGRVEVGIMMSK